MNYSSRLVSQPDWQMRAKLETAKQQTSLRKARRLSEHEYEFRGHNLTVQTDTASEILLCGAAGTGKTLARLKKLNREAWDYPKSRHLIVRKVRADLAQSVLVTFERDILGEDNPICAGVQREGRKVYRYPNGSEIIVGGMDRPGRILSSEYDTIYPAEAVEFEQQDWETLVMRNRNGVMPYQQIIGDTNPDRPDHWLKQRCDSGQAKLLNTYHKDNPRYWQHDDWTAAGRDYVLGKLASLSGVWRDRYLKGLWVLAEGAIYYMWDDNVHLIEAQNLPRFIRRYRTIDFGFRNPFVCQWYGEDSDGRLYLYREIYMTGLLVEDAARLITELSDGETIDLTVADHDAEDRATLARHGIHTIAANKAVSPGIQAVQSRLRVDASGKPALYIAQGARVQQDMELKHAGKPSSTQEEIGGYIWSNKKKEAPVKDNDHGMDALRYMIAQLTNTHSFEGLITV